MVACAWCVWIAPAGAAAAPFFHLPIPFRCEGGLAFSGRDTFLTADSPFYRFSTPPVPLVVSPVFPRCTGVCVFVPLWDSPRILSFGVVSRAKRSE